MAKKAKKQGVTPMWEVQEEGPRTYRIAVEAAAFTPATNREGALIQYGDENLMNLVLMGTVEYLDEDGEVTGVADPEMGEDMVARRFTIGDTSEFKDEDGTEERVTLKGRKAPRTRFDGGMLFKSLVELAGGEWLSENLGDWNEAASWVGHTLTIKPTPRVAGDGSPVYRSGVDDNGNKRQEIDSACVAVDDITAA